MSFLKISSLIIGLRGETMKRSDILKLKEHEKTHLTLAFVFLLGLLTLLGGTCWYAVVHKMYVQAALCALFPIVLFFYFRERVSHGEDSENYNALLKKDPFQVPRR